MQKKSFEELNLSQNMLSAVQEMGFTEASPIQSESIPLLLQGLDVVGQAQTGTGKTAAFGIPLLETLKTEGRHVKAIIMCPTRELSLQVATELKRLAKFMPHIRIAAVYGGEPIQQQIIQLKRGVDIVVGTPGRIMDHLDRGTLSLEQIQTVILDEADEMLNRGFREDIEQILTDTPKERQTVLFSATMPKMILNIIHNYQREPKFVTIVRDQLTSTSIEQYYYEVTVRGKTRAIAAVMQFEGIQTAMVFCNTKRAVDEVVQSLREIGCKADAIHGDLNQNQRNKVIASLRAGETNLLVATDVAARGLDISHVDGVFNYDLPHDFEYYVHRIGRTGRANKTGKSFSFVTGRNELRALRQIEQFTKAKVERRNVPTEKELAAFRKRSFIEKVNTTLTEEGLERETGIVAEFQEMGISAEQLATALLKMYLPARSATADMHEDENVTYERREYSDRGPRKEYGSQGGGRKPAYGDRDRKPYGGGSSSGGGSYGGKKEYGNKGGYGGSKSYGDKPSYGGGKKEFGGKSGYSKKSNYQFAD